MELSINLRSIVLKDLFWVNYLIRKDRIPLMTSKLYIVKGDFK